MTCHAMKKLVWNRLPVWKSYLMKCCARTALQMENSRRITSDMNTELKAYAQWHMKYNKKINVFAGWLGDIGNAYKLNNGKFWQSVKLTMGEECNVTPNDTRLIDLICYRRVVMVKVHHVQLFYALKRLKIVCFAIQSWFHNFLPKRSAQHVLRVTREIEAFILQQCGRGFEKRTVKCYVWSVVLDSCETWTTGRRETTRLKLLNCRYGEESRGLSG